MTTMMTEFPPAARDQVTLANWRSAPFNRWAFHHVRELIPTADIPNDPLHYIPTTNDRPAFMTALAILAQEHLNADPARPLDR